MTRAEANAGSTHLEGSSSILFSLVGAGLVPAQGDHKGRPYATALREEPTTTVEIEASAQAATPKNIAPG